MAGGDNLPTKETEMSSPRTMPVDPTLAMLLDQAAAASGRTAEDELDALFRKHLKAPRTSSFKRALSAVARTDKPVAAQVFLPVR